MRANAGIFCILCLLLLVGAVAGYLPDTSTIATSKQWVIANGVDQATITVMVSNESHGPVSGAQVIFATDNPLYGTLSPVTIVSDKATSTFRANTTSGAAIITATITSDDGYTVVKTLTQYIDHDSPYIVTFSHPLRGNVTEEVLFNASFTDRHGNPIDNRNPSGTHTISLHVHGPSPDDCIFTGYGHDLLNMPLNPDGNLSINVQLTSKAGTNYILMDMFGSISDKMEFIQAVSDNEPFYMTGAISPEGALKANNIDYFTINYFLYDVYGNPLNNRSIWVNTTLNGDEEQVLKTSNSLGQIQLRYGPKVTINNITITAISIDNQSVTNILYAEFINAGVKDMVLAITPQILMSREIPNSTPANVYGIVTGYDGKPLPGEIITFEILSITNDPTAVRTGDPSFDSTSDVLKIDATTDDNGIAKVYLYPGSFNSTYHGMASGSCYVQASWNSKHSQNPDIKVEWKNYPYLSIMVSATPQEVRINDTITVNITVVGNGYMMVRNGISVVLDIDTTSNLAATSDGTNGKTRWINAQEASTTFVKNMSDQDQVGLVTHGFWDNYKYWQLIQNVSYNKPLILAAIPNLTPSGGLGGNATTLKDSVLAAADIISDNPLKTPNEVPAIITIGANSYAKNSDDLSDMVRATWTDHHIRIYSILYVSTTNACDKNNDGTYKSTDAQNLDALTNKTHGKFYCALSRNEVDTFFVDIYQNLTDIAGANATMNLSFERVPVNSTPMIGGEVFDYIPYTTTTWPNKTVTIMDQSSEWIPPDYQLHFNIGTIKIGEIWQTEYRLKLKTNQTGLIELFASGSKITFNDGSELNLPAVFLTAVSNLTSFGSQNGTLDVSNLVVTKSGNFTDYVPLEWNLKYEGFNTTTETLCYCVGESCPDILGCPNSQWVLFDTRADIAPAYYTPRVAQLDVRKLPMGRYWMRVHAFAPDARDDEETFGPINVGNAGVFIKLS